MNLGTNWRTTLAGVGTIAVPLLNQIIPVLPPQWAAVVSGVIAGVGLIAAKDSNVTGGTVRQ